MALNGRRGWIGYAILVLGIALALSFQAANFRKFDQVNETRCADQKRSWDTLSEMIEVQTVEIAVPPSLVGDPDEVERYALSNERRARQRVELTDRLGPRPDC